MLHRLIERNRRSWLLIVAGKNYSLDDMEHTILRKMGEPRVHFAIVCASVGCPRLRNEAYTQANISAQLDDNARDFFSRRQNLRISGNTLLLSPILGWFRDDFGTSQTARLRTIKAHLPASTRQLVEKRSTQVRYLDYDWSLNDQSRRQRMTQTFKDRRRLAERLFLVLFFPTVTLFYVIYKYPGWLLGDGNDPRAFHLLGKSPGFWYGTVYTTLVCGTCLWVLISSRNRYQRSKKKSPLSKYQRGKFASIFFAQLIAFYLLPYVLPALRQPGGFFNDPTRVATKAAHIYVYPGFTSWGMAVYLFLVIPVAVWFFGKRYCSWFCSCGNLAEAVGVLPWGRKWVRLHTPRGKTAKELEVVQLWVLLFAVFFGVMLLLDGLTLLSVASFQSFQDLVIDFAFGSLVGVGAYPILGTRIWCRYGCPMAQGMKRIGKFTRSRFSVVPNANCRGLNLCTQACPMGIDVASYAHKDKQPIEVAFGLKETSCIGCGGCIDVCPVDALAFAPIGRGGAVVVAGEGETETAPTT